MPKLSAPAPRQQQLLKEFGQKLAAKAQELAPAVTAEVDYGMLSVPLIGLAVAVLKQRGLSREEIEMMVMETVERQFNSGESTPLLHIVR